MSPGRYSFSHALIQHTLYEDLVTTRRTRLHKAVGEAIERLCGENSDDASGSWPATSSSPPDPPMRTRPSRYAQRAGDAALAALAPDDAVRYFSQALELAAQSVECRPD